MKFNTTSSVAFMALAANAYAADTTSSFCKSPSQACWKVKRVAEAFTDSISDIDTTKPQSTACVTGDAMNAIDELGSRMVASSAADLQTRSFRDWFIMMFNPNKNKPITARGKWCDKARGSSCNTAVDAISEIKATEQNIAARGEWCKHARGARCYRKRDAISTVEQDIQARGEWCKHARGAHCYRNVNTSSIAAVPVSDYENCNKPGQPCHRAKRAAEAIVNTVDVLATGDSTENVEARDEQYHHK